MKLENFLPIRDQKKVYYRTESADSYRARKESMEVRNVGWLKFRSL